MSHKRPGTLVAGQCGDGERLDAALKPVDCETAPALDAFNSVTHYGC